MKNKKLHIAILIPLGIYLFIMLGAYFDKDWTIVNGLIWSDYMSYRLLWPLPVFLVLLGLVYASLFWGARLFNQQTKRKKVTGAVLLVTALGLFLVSGYNVKVNLLIDRVEQHFMFMPFDCILDLPPDEDPGRRVEFIKSSDIMYDYYIDRSEKYKYEYWSGFGVIRLQ